MIKDNRKYGLHSVVPIIANNHTDLETLGSLAYAGAQIARRPTLNGCPRQEFAVFLNYFSFGVDEHERIVRIFLWVLFMLLSRQAKDTPNSHFLADVAKHVLPNPRRLAFQYPS
jgi:hypothetical protein